jgi:hypothetical protein
MPRPVRSVGYKPNRTNEAYQSRIEVEARATKSGGRSSRDAPAVGKDSRRTGASSWSTIAQFRRTRSRGARGSRTSRRIASRVIARIAAQRSRITLPTSRSTRPSTSRRNVGRAWCSRNATRVVGDHFGGIVPTANANFPGEPVSSLFRAEGVSHMNVYYRIDGIRRISAAMFAVGMARR